jgi:hypothetical protein
MANQLNKKEQLLAIRDANSNLDDRMKSWDAFYDKKADTVTIGLDFPANTYLTYLDDDGFLLRVDSNNMIHSFVIENASKYKKIRKELSLPLSVIMYPTRTKYITLPILFAVYQMSIGLDKISSSFELADFAKHNMHYAN